VIESIDYLLRPLKIARERKGLSPRALAEKTGLPQSHLSKIENAEVDVQVSNLVEIARVLDLELFLVPRQMIPAIRTLQRGMRLHRPSALETSIRDQIGRLIARLGKHATHQPDAAAQQLVAALAQLRTAPIPTAMADAVQQRLYAIRATLGRGKMSKADRSQEQPLGDHVRDLELLRVRIAIGDEPEERRPAYSLDAAD
jgi:transcriptional regulator with XRE-family HTH domain